MGPDLAEDGVVGGDRQVADEVQHVTAADGPARHLRDDRLGHAAHLHVQVGDVEATDRVLVGLVAAVAAYALVTAGAERLVALAGEDDDADLLVLAGDVSARARSR